MDTISRDMGALMRSEKKTSECFLDVVGADIDGSYKDSLTYI